MKFTEHARLRMGQRGIPAAMLDFVREHGEVRGDAIILDRSAVRALLDQLDRMRKQAIKVLDKGGVGVVEQGDSIITTYNIDGRRRNDY